MLNPWFALTFKAIQLGIDAQNVMTLRMMRLASGGTGARNEMTRMVIERLLQQPRLRWRRLERPWQEIGIT